MNYFCTIEKIQAWAERFPQKIAMVYGKRTYTYRFFYSALIKIARSLESKGIKKGSLVALELEHRAFEVLVTFGLEAIGAIRITQRDDKHLAGRLNFLITDQKTSNPPGITCIVLDSQFFTELFTENHLNEELEFKFKKAEPGDPIFISATSGTTGLKKYFIDTYSGLWANLELMQSLYFPLENTIFWSTYKLNVGAAYAGCCLALITGGRIIFSGLEDILNLLPEVSNSHAALILKDAKYFRDKHPYLKLKNKISSLRILGASLPLDLRHWLEEHLAEKVSNSYSSNETGQIGEVLPTGITKLYDGVQVKIFNDDWVDMGIGTNGLIAVKSSQLIPQYLWNEDLNKVHFRDGWFRTNDIGRLLSERELVVLDRADNMLIVGGVKVPPTPIEDQLRQLPFVRDAALLNDPLNRDSGVVACIQTTNGTDHAKARQQIEKFLHQAFPVRVAFLDAFPLTESGKVKKFELVQQLMMN